MFRHYTSGHYKLPPCDCFTNFKYAADLISSLLLCYQLEQLFSVWIVEYVLLVWDWTSSLYNMGFVHLFKSLYIALYLLPSLSLEHTHPCNRGHLVRCWKKVNCRRMNFRKIFYDWLILGMLSKVLACGCRFDKTILF